MEYKSVIYTVNDRIARLTLDRPEVGNAINQDMAREIEEVCLRINRDNSVYVAVLNGTGDTFCTGSEVEEAADTYRPAAAIAGIECPTIAAINGDAFGLGLELTLSCDIRLSSSQASFALPQVAGGRIPSDGGTQRLPRIIGRGKAMELLLTAATISAEEALKIGLVSRVVPPETLPEEADKLAAMIAAKGPIALRYLKEAVIKGMDMTLEQGLRLEADLYFLLHTTADRTEGITAFLEKRDPNYKGE